MTKTHILEEIRRTAQANDGKPLGSKRFMTETGIGLADWSKFWARWSDAIRDAGLSPNQMNAAFEDDTLLGTYAKLAQDLGRLPTNSDLRFRARSEHGFPSHNTFRRLGSKVKLTRKLLNYCRAREGYEEISRWCEQSLPKREDGPDDEVVGEKVEIGFVYLIRSARYYKIGRSNSVGRREYELGIQLPEAVTTVHALRTDDPVGIEAYWHKRFEAKRKNGEWFELSAADVAAFKRRKFM
jgi:hypothetical protein